MMMNVSSIMVLRSLLQQFGMPFVHMLLVHVTQFLNLAIINKWLFQ